MDARQRKRKSKFLSLIFRHQPDTIGISLDEAGWVDVDLLLAAMKSQRDPITHAELQEIVATSEKQRFAFSEDGKRIRANQGHSVHVDLGFEAANPPELLFHGTVERFLDSIRKQGLLRGSRHHVHLSADEATAANVGGRRGKPVILVIDAQAMKDAGYEFFVSPNGVWLTEHVPPEYLRFP